MMTHIILLGVAFIVIMGYAYLTQYLFDRIIDASQTEINEHEERQVLKGRWLGALLSGMISLVIWLFTIDRLTYIHALHWIFFLQAVLFINFYIQIMAEEFTTTIRKKLGHDTVMFTIVLASALSLMIIDLFTTTGIAIAAFLYVFFI